MKPPKPYAPSDLEKGSSLADVAYEIQQLTQLLNLSAGPPGVERNARIESALVHTRQLLDFFEDEVRSVFRRSENDDVLALDYGFGAKPVDIEDAWRLRLNKDLVHLSYSRQSRLGDAKEWNMPALAPLVDRCRDFAAHVLAEWGSRLDEDQLRRWIALHAWLGGS